MTKIKKDLLVSVADANFIPQVKQLFSSVYHNSGWEGDYMLLTDSLPEADVKWFRDRGIIIFSPPLLSQQKFGHRSYPPILFSKLYLFHQYFKKWRSVVFLDSDIIVRASFSALANLPGFNASLAIMIKLKNEFTEDAIKYLPKKYNLKSKAFSSGVFSFNTAIIDRETLPNLLNLFYKYKDICFFGEEAILNLYFYKKWFEISELYNFIPWYMKRFYAFSDMDFPVPIVHWSCAEKPWEKDHVNYQEWHNNLCLADKIDLNNRLKATKVWSRKDIKSYSFSIRLKYVLFIIKIVLAYIDRQIGRLGLLIKKISPSIYERIKFNNKNEKR